MSMRSAGPAAGHRPRVSPTRLLGLLALAGTRQVAERALDGIWHANHDEFEDARQQLEAHWLIWLGVFVTITVCSLALRALEQGHRARWSDIA